MSVYLVALIVLVLVGAAVAGFRDANASKDVLARRHAFRHAIALWLGFVFVVSFGAATLAERFGIGLAAPLTVALIFGLAGGFVSRHLRARAQKQGRNLSGSLPK